MLRGFGVDCVQGYYLEKPRADHPLILSATRRRDSSMELRFT